MSYDVGLVIDTGGPEPVGIENTWENYTYNCGPMFRLALGGDGINDLAGQVAGDVIERLARAYDHMRARENSATYEAMNPPNGWGKHDTATAFIGRILEHCRAHPKAIVRVS